jgi:YD repeat-containing protein
MLETLVSKGGQNGRRTHPMVHAATNTADLFLLRRVFGPEGCQVRKTWDQESRLLAKHLLDGDQGGDDRLVELSPIQSVGKMG